ncbi:MAG TPA: SdpI family protein [Rhizomicrobium sp.]|jgi:uncharacterized membrane protein|nr:SdpI family protein [Rhizomicrobium sp.]
MGSRAIWILSLLIVAGLAAAGAWEWTQLPAGARMAIHFGFDGAPNGFAGKTVALAIAPVAALITTLAFGWIGRTRETDNEAYRTGWITALMVLCVVQMVIILNARDVHFDVRGNIAIAMAFVMIVTGNVLGKTAPNRLVGVRTPWTRRSAYSWGKSNRMAGRLFVCVGFVTLGTLALAGSAAGIVVLTAGVLGVSALGAVLSYYYWKHDPETGGESR